MENYKQCENEHIVTIKLISASNFEIMLIEMPTGKYKIAYEFEGRPYISENIADYSIANLMFEGKLVELKNVYQKDSI